MKQHSILIVDRQMYWREFAAETLRSAGYGVATFATYDEALSQQRDFLIVLLGCTTVGSEERMLIMRLLAQKQHVIVLVTSLSAQTMRLLFIRGAEDVGDKTYDPADLLGVVKQTLQRITFRKSFQYP